MGCYLQCWLKEIDISNKQLSTETSVMELTNFKIKVANLKYANRFFVKTKWTLLVNIKSQQSGLNKN